MFCARNPQNNNNRCTMNIFILCPNIHESAHWLFSLDKQRANKQIVELTQCVSAVTDDWYHSPLPKMDGTPYTTTHKNHPCTKWIGANSSNLMATIRYGLALCDQYNILTGKTHGCKNALIKAYQLVSFMQDNTPFSVNVLAMVFAQMPRFGKAMPNTGNIFNDCVQHILNKQAKETL